MSQQSEQAAKGPQQSVSDLGVIVKMLSGWWFTPNAKGRTIGPFKTLAKAKKEAERACR